MNPPVHPCVTLMALRAIACTKCPAGYVVSPATGLGISNVLSIEFSFIPSKLVIYNTIIYLGTNYSTKLNYYLFFTGSSNTLSLRWGDGVIYSTKAYNIASCVGSLHHYVVVIGSNYNYLFIDGKLWGSDTHAVVPTSGTGSCCLCNSLPTNTEYNPGGVGFIRVYSVALSVSEIMSLYYNSINLDYYIYSNKLKAWYDFAPVGNVIPDLSGNGNHAVLTGPYSYQPSMFDPHEWE